MALVLSGALTAFVLIMGVVLAYQLGLSNGRGRTAERSAAADRSVVAEDVSMRQPELPRPEASVGVSQDEGSAATRQPQREATVGQLSPAAGQVGPVRSAAAARAIISPERAAQIAVQALGGGRARSVELEREHGRVVYEVKIGRTEIYVDATTGEAFQERDDDDD
jgi:uncharacterized membrane protein YkoI